MRRPAEAVYQNGPHVPGGTTKHGLLFGHALDAFQTPDWLVVPEAQQSGQWRRNSTDPGRRCSVGTNHGQEQNRTERHCLQVEGAAGSQLAGIIRKCSLYSMQEGSKHLQTGIPCMLSGRARMVRFVARLQATFAREITVSIQPIPLWNDVRP